jgi:PKD repeat protein
MHMQKNILKSGLIAITSLVFSCSPANFGACFNADDNNVSPNQVITFTNCSSLGSSNQECNWSFGDGKDTVVVGNAAVTHAYKTIGSYTVQLTTGVGTDASTHTLDISVF